MKSVVSLAHIPWLIVHRIKQKQKQIKKKNTENDSKREERSSNSTKEERDFGSPYLLQITFTVELLIKSLPKKERKKKKSLPSTFMWQCSWRASPPYNNNDRIILSSYNIHSSRFQQKGHRCNALSLVYFYFSMRVKYFICVHPKKKRKKNEAHTYHLFSQISLTLYVSVYIMCISHIIQLYENISDENGMRNAHNWKGWIYLEFISW